MPRNVLCVVLCGLLCGVFCFFRFTARCKHPYLLGFIGATDWDRTSNLRLRRPTLYPIELQSQLFVIVYQKFHLQGLIFISSVIFVELFNLFRHIGLNRKKAESFLCNPLENDA